jgi:mevalonate kinase
MQKSALTKIILIGEHAVLYGAHGICLPFSEETVVSLNVNAAGMKVSCNQDLSADTEQYLFELVEGLNKTFEKCCDLKVHFEFNAPMGMGFGVSASSAIALTKALYGFYNENLSAEKLLEIVEGIEEKNHGKSSGIDHKTILSKQGLLFQLGEEAIAIPEILENDVLKSCYVLVTGQPKESTKEMVEAVAELYKDDPDGVGAIFEELDEKAIKLLEVLKTGDSEDFAQIIDRAGVLLEKLNLLTPRVKKLCAKLREVGAAVKISGAGGRSGEGSGALLAYHQSPRVLEEFCQQENISFFPLVKPASSS